MGKNVVWIVLGFVVLLLVGYFVYSSGNIGVATTSPDRQMSGTESTSPIDTNSPGGGGSYVPFSQGVIEMHATSKRVLYFYANWCPTCRPVDAEFQARESQIPEGVVVIRVNYNDSDTDAAEKVLATQYGITYQHTFVQIDEQGNAVKTWNGGGLAELKQNII